MSTTALPRRRTRINLAEINRSQLALYGLLALTTVAYLWNLTESGYANSFYAAAVQAGTRSWKALFFGSLDSSNFITVDKPPASLWVMALSGRIFGFDSASMLVPQVLEGVAAVALLHAAVKRWFGAGAGLLAGALLAVTPVAALMFRFNNPDALLVCLLVASAYALVRALDQGSTRWLAAVGVLLGFAFLTKMLAAFLVLPGFALVYFLAAPVSSWRRVRQLLVAGAALLIGCGWWLAAVALWPVASRPMIDGSPDNNIFNLIFGYNGLSRVDAGSGAAGGGGRGGGANFSGATGPLRLFNELMGGQASWLLPAALLALIGGLWVTRRASRADRTRAALLLWGSWLLVTGAVFSFSSGTIHTYYTVALVPAIAALVAVGVTLAWRERERPAARALLALGVAVSAGWAIVLLERTSGWQPWLVPLVAVSGAGAAGMFLMPSAGQLALRRAGATLAAVACLAGPLAYTIQTLSVPHSGTLPTAGPTVSGAQSLGSAPVTTTGRVTSHATAGVTAGGPGDVDVGAALTSALKADAAKYRWVAATSGSQSAAELELASDGDPVMAIGGFNGEGGRLTLTQFERYVKAGDIHYYVVSSGGLGAGGFRGAAGGFGRGGFAPPAIATGGSGAASPSRGSATGGAQSSVVAALFGSHGGSTKRAAGAGAGGLAGRPGRFGGRAGFAAPRGGAGGYSDSAITTWVEAHFHKQTIGGQTVYDLTDPT